MSFWNFFKYSPLQLKSLPKSYKESHRKMIQQRLQMAYSQGKEEEAQKIQGYYNLLCGE